MSKAALAGDWVEIALIVLEKGQRAPQVPADTQAVPLEMRVHGRLLKPASLGAEVEIETAAGRLVRGRLTVLQPAYTHGFGRPIPELIPVGAEVRALLRQRGPQEK